MKFDVVIIGAGAAGLFCAIEAGRRGRRVLLLEHNGEVGRKILVSGGGRCNFTNKDVRPENFISANRHFCKSALARYTPADFIDLVKKHRIAYYEKTLGQLFCRESARQIVDMLLRECEQANVKIRTATTVTRVEKNGALFEIETSSGSFSTESLVIATGGLSFPKIGATDFGFQMARQFGIKVLETRPSLVALAMADGKGLSALAGVSADAEVSFDKAVFRENILFTHRGLSGPAILQISNYWKKNRPVSVDLLPSIDALKLLEDHRDGRQQLGNFLSGFLPRRFAESFPSAAKPLNQLSNKEITDIAAHLNNWQVLFNDTEGYNRAEVTLGGISTDELSSQTMESKKVNGLYFIGEIVDVTGWLGGYNFQWAWSSGFVCGQSV